MIGKDFIECDDKLYQINFSDEDFQIIHHVGKRLRPALPPIRSNFSKKMELECIEKESQDDSNSNLTHGESSSISLNVELLREIGLESL